MPPVSLRPLVVTGVAPFAELFAPLAREGDVTGVLVELIVGLSHYSEEGLAYAPLVFVTTDLAAMLAAVHGSEPIIIGTDLDGGMAARTALRNCAPLGAGRRWAVFVRLGERGGEYGIFRPESSPLRPTSFDILRRNPQHGTPIVGLTQLRSGVVETRSSSGLGRYFDFSGSSEEAMNPASVVQSFVAAVTSAVGPEVQAQLQAFYYRIGVDILTGDHGALAAVLGASAVPPPFLTDGLWLQAPLDLSPWVKRYNAGASSEDAQALLAYAQLIRRMTMMDGVTVFGADGTVRAYGCFLREAAGSSAVTHVVGGARRRAYDLLRTHVGQGLDAALYRSQDGAAECVTTSTRP